MAQFRSNHSSAGRRRSGSSFPRMFLMILVVAGIMVGIGFLIRRDYFGSLFRGTEAWSYTIPVSGSDPAARYYLPLNGKGEVIHHRYYSLSYLEPFELAEWVAYELTRTNLEKPAVNRTDWFTPDPAIRSGSAVHADYTRSGYTRGHLVPAGDMAFDQLAMEECFFMSNIAPQLRDFNNGSWRELEEQVRRWAMGKQRLYVVAGPVLSPGVKGKTIGRNEVFVPDRFFKVLLDADDPEIGAIGFILDQDKGTMGFSDFAVPVDSVEQITGLDFFADLLSDELEERVESEVQPAMWK